MFQIRDKGYLNLLKYFKFSSINCFKLLSVFDNSRDKGCSFDNAQNEAPKIVSGLVVKIFIF